MAKRTSIFYNKSAASNYLFFAVLSIIVLVLYGKTYNYGFVVDDGIVWENNTFVLSGISGIKDIFLHDTFDGYLKSFNMQSMALSGGRYRPLSLAFFAILNQVFGTNPVVGHVSSILIYMASSCIFFVFISKLLTYYELKNSKTIAVLAALLFSVHPVHTEVVANIKSMDENICFFFGLSALLLLWLYEEKRAIYLLCLSTVSMLLSLLSKETGVVLIPIYILSVWKFRHLTSLVEAIKKSSPLLLAFAVYLLFRINAIGLNFGQNELETNLMNNPFLKTDQAGNMIPLSFLEHVSILFAALLKYIQLLIFPIRLTHDYYPHYFPVSGFTTDFLSIVSLLLYALLILSVFYFRKTNTIVSFSSAFYLISILIFSNIFFNIGVNLAERFLFFPSVAWALILAVFIVYIRRQNVLLGNLLMVLVFGFYSIKTFTRNSDWKDNYTLATADVKTSSNSVRALSFAANEILLKNNGSVLKDGAEIQQGISYIEKAMRIYPYLVDNHITMANLYLLNQEWHKAIPYYENLLKQKVNNPDISKNLATCYLEYGKNVSRNNQAKAGVEYIKKAYQLHPVIETQKMLGIAYARNFQYKEAQQTLEDVLQNDPGDSAIKEYINLLKLTRTFQVIRSKKGV